jgi:hypothetical protein
LFSAVSLFYHPTNSNVLERGSTREENFNSQHIGRQEQCAIHRKRGSKNNTEVEMAIIGIDNENGKRKSSENSVEINGIIKYSSPASSKHFFQQTW